MPSLCVTEILWLQLLVVGLPLLAIAYGMYVSNFVSELGSSLRDLETVSVPPEAVKGVPADELYELADALKAAGFRDLYSYTAPRATALGMRNYGFVLVSQDGRTFAEVFYIRCPWSLRALLFLASPCDVRFSIVGLSCSSVKQNGSRLTTTTNRFMVNKLQREDLSEVVSDGTPEDVVRFHAAAMERFEPLASLKTFSEPKHYLDYMRQRAAFADRCHR